MAWRPLWCAHLSRLAECSLDFICVGTLRMGRRPCADLCLCARFVWKNSSDRHSFSKHESHRKSDGGLKFGLASCMAVVWCESNLGWNRSLGDVAKAEVPGALRAAGSQFGCRVQSARCRYRTVVLCFSKTLGLLRLLIRRNLIVARSSVLVSLDTHLQVFTRRECIR
jgi:hypothetical protein